MPKLFKTVDKKMKVTKNKKKTKSKLKKPAPQPAKPPIEDEPSDDEDELPKFEADGSSGDEDIDMPTSDVEDDHGNSSGDEITTHKESLDKLKHTDPEFYQFLQENDQKLLNFNVSDSESDGDQDDDDDEGDAGAKLHIPQQELEIASDESDFEVEGEEPAHGTRHISLKLLKTWQNDVKTDKTNKTILNVINAFHSAIARVAAQGDDQEPLKFVVDGSAVFNAVVQICVLELGPAINRFLGLKTGKKKSHSAPHKCKRFPKLRTALKLYFIDLHRVLINVTSPNILSVILKHLHYMATLLASYAPVSKLLVKRLILLWGTTQDELVRLLSFLCILRITNNQRALLLDSTLKTMYMAYVRNSKFMSASDITAINFMRRSLVEMYALDPAVSYPQAFLYIRQLAIHLRNAITLKKKENVQVVYNWQYVNSLRLWGSLLAATHNKAQLQPLVYPFVQICLGALKLHPTTQYYPLRFHVVQILMDLSRDTGVFIPILPFILEVLSSYNFNKRSQKTSLKPLQFTYMLRASKSQLVESGFKDGVLDTIYGLLLEYLAHQSQSIAFPDLALNTRIQLKKFNKTCSIAQYTRKTRQLLEKVEQNAQFIESERRKVTFALTDLQVIEGWETTLRNKGTPLLTFFNDWDKLRQVQRNKRATENEELADYKLPKLKKRRNDARNVSRADNVEQEVTLFPSDDEDDDDDGDKSFAKGSGDAKAVKKRGSRGGKNKRGFKKAKLQVEPVVQESGDIVNDIDVADW